MGVRCIVEKCYGQRQVAIYCTLKSSMAMAVLAIPVAPPLPVGSRGRAAEGVKRGAPYEAVGFLALG